jgi:hypothetical protein
MSGVTVAPEPALRESVLLVEGRGGQPPARDVGMLAQLLSTMGVEVQGGGGCDQVATIVQAVRHQGVGIEPGRDPARYYAVVDRDHRDDEDVERSWAGGPFADRRYLLVWRRHELENYLLEPGFVCQSRYFRDDRSPEDVAAALVRRANERRLLDAANLTIQRARAAVRTFDVALLRPGHGGFASASGAERTLLACPEWAQVRGRLSGAVTEDALIAGLRQSLRAFTGAGEDDELVMGRGRWLDLMFGAELLDGVLCAAFFRVPASGGGYVQGPDLIRAVARDLMRRFDELAYQPADLAALRAFFTR